MVAASHEGDVMPTLGLIPSAPDKFKQCIVINGPRRLTGGLTGDARSE